MLTFLGLGGVGLVGREWCPPLDDGRENTCDSFKKYVNTSLHTAALLGDLCIFSTKSEENCLLGYFCLLLQQSLMAIKMMWLEILLIFLEMVPHLQGSVFVVSICKLGL